MDTLLVTIIVFSLVDRDKERSKKIKLNIRNTTYNLGNLILP